MNRKTHFGFKQVDEKDKYEFQDYVNQRDYFNPHIMFIAKPHVAKKWFDTLFPWLERCENVFGFDLKGYGNIRIYAFLAERFLPYWFNKYSTPLSWPVFFFDTNKNRVILKN